MTRQSDDMADKTAAEREAKLLEQLTSLKAELKQAKTDTQQAKTDASKAKEALVHAIIEKNRQLQHQKSPR